MVAVPVTAAELRALAAVHRDYADAASLCECHAEAAGSWDRAEHLRALSERLGPPPGEDDTFLTVGP